jgi:hypothetical protein
MLTFFLRKGTQSEAQKNKFQQEELVRQMMFYYG